MRLLLFVRHRFVKATRDSNGRIGPDVMQNSARLHFKPATAGAVRGPGNLVPKKERQAEEAAGSPVTFA
jgi:hypothetical protein